jgi:mannonate dehydratase
MKTAVNTLVAAGLAPNLLAPAACAAQATSKSANPRGMQLAERYLFEEDQRLQLAAQIGLNYTIMDVASVLDKVPPSRYLEVLEQGKAKLRSMGLQIAGVESHPVKADKIILGLPGRDEQMQNYLAAIEALGKAGIPMLCWHFMAGFSWYRTSLASPARGGALTTEFDHATAEAQGYTQWGEVSEDRMWRNMEYFLKAAIPAAEKANVKMALHPDDPPLPKLRGISRIVISAKNYNRIMDMVPSPINGVTYCQANFKLMGEDLAGLAQEWIAKNKIFFVHFRDVQGNREHFIETFHDNGPTDMARMLKVYTDAGFDGPIRPDHTPTLVGEENNNPGYAMEGKVLALGWMRGILKGSGRDCV